MVTVGGLLEPTREPDGGVQMDHKVNTVLRNGALASFAAGLVVAQTATAAEWTVNKRVTVSEVFTDNVELERNNKQSEWITTLTPHVSVSGKGAGAELNLNASLEANTLDGAAESVNPRVGASGKAELIEDWVYLDGAVNILQNTVDAFSNTGSDLLNRTGNTTNTYNYEISPYLSHSFGSTADVIAQYTFNHQSNSSDQVSDSDRHEISLGISSGDDFQTLIWGADVNYKDTDASNNFSSSEQTSADLTLGYQLSRQWLVRGSVGQEWNSYSSNRSENDGSRWSLSTTWTPSPRTTLVVGFGNRFFGSVPSLDFTHRSKRSIFTASYSKTLTDTATLLGEQNAFQTTDAFGNPIDPITGDPLPNGTNFNLTDGLFVSERLRLGYTLVGRRSSLNLSASWSQQDYEDSRPNEIVEQYSVNFTRSLSPQLELDAGVTWSQQDRSGASESETLTYNLGLSRDVGSDGQLRFVYRMTDKDSDTLINDYQENRLQLSFTKSL